MSIRRTLTLLAALLAATATLMAGGAGAQEPTGTEPEAVLVSIGTAFTYQGRLVDAGIPAGGVYDFQFRLYDAASGGVQIGALQAVDDVTVSGGLFTVAPNFGPGAFDGQARWLEIAVKRDVDGSYTTLSPRVALTPAPHALALPGLWTQQHATSPNLIGGYAGNVMGADVFGGVIAGGGTRDDPNHVFDWFGSVGGGYGNQAGQDDGLPSWSSFATVAGGFHNAARAGVSTVGGGASNNVSGAYSTVGGGYQNSANGESSTVGGGKNNSAGGPYSTVGGGWHNTTSDPYSTVPGGTYASATHYGEQAYASGRFAADGDAQASLYVLRRETGDDTLTELFLAESYGRITLAADRVMTFDILVVGSHRFGGGSSAGYQVAGVIRNIGGVTSFVGTPVTTVLGENVAGWDVQVEANDALHALVIKVQGSSATTVRWVASVRTVEVGR